MLFALKRRASTLNTGGAMLIVALLLLTVPTVDCQRFWEAKGVNGGLDCAACTAFVALTEQFMGFHNVTLIETLTHFCDILPQQFKPACSEAIHFIGPLLITLIAKDAGPDVICHALKFCQTEKGSPTCSAFVNVADIEAGMLELKAGHLRVDLMRGNPKRMRYLENIDQKGSICSVPGIKEICEWIGKTLHLHNPLLDIDGDGFSSIFAARGSAWRGRDCSDISKDVHPGARPHNHDMFFDSNCNGIYGFNEKTRRPFEEELCENSDSKGFAILGDSMGAHFHFPSQWINPMELSQKAFRHFEIILENEIDWPSMSSGTGYGHNKWPEAITGPIDSIYERLRNRNKCNHRDYQNIAVNGARSWEAASTQVKSLSRTMTDKPLLVAYAFFGNDVCNRFPDTFDHMTTPDQMLNNTMNVMDQLHQILPNGSHVVMLSLLDGRVLFDNMHNRTHPLGSFWGNLTYSRVYDFLNCLQISPCRGWLNSNSTIRDLTAAKVEKLNDVLEHIAYKYEDKYPNFKIHFMRSPLDRVLNRWKKKGGQIFELIEPADGFHCNQYAQALFAQEVWKNMLDRPDVLGPENPYNKLIHDLFGDQGGH